MMWSTLKRMARRHVERKRLAEIEEQRAIVRQVFDKARQANDTRKQHDAAERAKTLTLNALRMSVR